MVFTTYGKETAMVRIGSDINEPAYIGIGSGSGVVSVTNTGLVHHTDRNAFTTSDLSVARKWEMIADFNSVEMSGTPLREFGIFVESSGGKLWQREGFAAIQFDGTNELQIQVTWEVY